MDERHIELVLKDDSHVERAESVDLRKSALNLIVATKDNLDTNTLPDMLLDLLSQIIKPLFSKEQHGKLTSTGRKNLMDQKLPAALERFSADHIFDNDKRPLWKNGWIASLLRYILYSYNDITNDATRRKTLDTHFHLLVPPILHQIDDVDFTYKVSGCECLRILCDNLRDIQSDILKRSGLADVFSEALKNNFSYLPSLTPEDESLMLYQALYPAFRSLVGARFLGFKMSTTTKSTKGLITDLDNTANSPPAELTEAEARQRQSYFVLILRHQLLYSLAHFSVGNGGGDTTCISLSTFLISQFCWIFSDMGISAVTHLQTILPLLRNILSDPFGTSSPEMLLESVKALIALIQVTWPRIQERWWSECLRGIVACWLNVSDDEKDMKDDIMKGSLLTVKHELRTAACLLEDIVGEPFTTAAYKLSQEDTSLQEMFNETL